MVGDIIVWMISFTLVITLIGTTVFQLMCLVDLSNDYVNPYDSAARINSVVLPEFVISGVLCFLNLISGQWVMFLLFLPYACYNMKLYTERHHLLDVTEIFNLISGAKRIRFYKLGYLAVALIFSIFWYRSKRVLCIINYGALRRRVEERDAKNIRIRGSTGNCFLDTAALLPSLTKKLLRRLL